MNITEWIFTNYECKNISLTTCLFYYNNESFLYFLDQGADVNATDRLEWTPLCCASIECHKDNVELLVSHRTNVNITNKDGYTPLHFALQKKIIKILLNT